MAPKLICLICMSSIRDGSKAHLPHLDIFDRKYTAKTHAQEVFSSVRWQVANIYGSPVLLIPVHECTVSDVD